MKKLMILAAAVVMATASQAAQFNWEFTDYTELGDYKGMTVYYMLGSSAKTDWASAKAIADASISSGTIAAEGPFVLASGVAKSDSLVKGTAASVYGVIFNPEDDMYVVTKVANVSGSKIYNAGESSSDKFAGLDSDAITGSWHPVPEPTSGLLMLLGVAGLALKRKSK